MRRCLLDVTKGHSGVESCGDEAVPQRVGTDLPVDPRAFRQTSYDPGRLVSVHSMSGVGSEDRSFTAFSDSEIHGARRARRVRDNDSLASLAVHLQCVVTPSESGISDIGAEGFGDSQAIESQQTRQGVVTGPGQTGLDEEGAEFVSVQAAHRRLLPQPGSPHVGARVVGVEFLLDAVPVEPGHGRKSVSDCRSGGTAVFEPPGKHLDVGPPTRKQVRILVGAPGNELTEILLIRQPSVAGAVGQEPSQCHLNLECLILASPRHRYR
jgi:hypothetical protein